MDFKSYINDRKRQVDQALERYLAEDRGFPEKLNKAVYYSVAAGGKRVRPILAIASAEAVGGSIDDVLPLAAALEMIHTFSLIHDDLPAMDDDDLRRGIPTNHAVYGEAMAILAGDALLAEAFYCITRLMNRSGVRPEVVVDVIKDVAMATGPRGMVGGQVLDLDAEGKNISLEELEKIHRHKTGWLLTVSVTAGAKVCGASPEQLAALRRYGEAIGLAFQVADDILDVEGNEDELGKPIGSDEANEKATFPAVIGLKASKERALRLVEEAHAAVKGFDDRAEPLREIARYIIERRS
jgi:geranylgeranyl diphosphate synthase type II